MNSVKKSLIIVCSAFFVLTVGTINGQGVYFDPSPTDVSGPARLYVDITSAECNCPELQDADPELNPLYIWTWGPSEERQSVDGVNVGNGGWNDSNENMLLKQDADNPNLWYYDFLDLPVSQFYNQPAGVFYETGVDFLVKEKDGLDEDPRQKSDDINLVLEPVGCFEKICPFPQTFFQDQYFFITYDNNKETIGFLQDLGPDECLIWYRIGVNGGPVTVFREETDKFKMVYDGDGVFSISMIPENYFELAEGDELTQIDVFITKPPIHIPPFTQPLTLIPGCE